MVRARKSLQVVPKRRDVFYAYPSEPPVLGETIIGGVRVLERHPELRRLGYRFRPWPDVPVGGRRLLTQITDAIDRATLFACDVTYLNANVAFELGYAIGKFKRVWVSLDTSIQNAGINYKQSYTGMLGAGYAPYENHETLAQAFESDRPWQTPDKHLLGASFRLRNVRVEVPTLLYVKPPHSTGPVVRTLELLRSSAFAEGLTIDDPRETPGTSLEWYAEKARDCDAVLVHLLSEKHEGADAHNAKASFVAGLALGLGKPLQMLAHTPFDCPTDYTTLLQSHDTAAGCETLLTAWLDNLPTSRRARRVVASAPRVAQRLELRNLSLGEPFAENEQARLDDYFVETSNYFTPFEAQTTVLVGRRGTGKTATLVALQAGFGADKRNHVCTIKPVGYEVDGLIRLLEEDWKAAERGFLVESLWKFLIYSELAASVVREIAGRPTYQEPSEDERRLIDYVQGNGDVLLAPFSQRLNRAVGALTGTGSLTSTETQRSRISEHLHDAHLGVLRQRLGAVLAGREKVAILVDNLDEPWRPGGNTRILSTLLLGLLRVTHNVVDDFSHPDPRRSVNVSLTTFIRSDIFAYLEPLANERDKWPLKRINWNDRQLLLRVVNERLERGGVTEVRAQDVWDKLMVNEVVGLPTPDFILNNTLARPRDVIFLVKEAVAIAVNRGHQIVEAEDFLSARESYSRYVFGSVLAEDDPQRQKMEPILYEFAGAKRTLTASDVSARIGRANVADEDVAFYVNLLCDVNFLGIRTAEGYSYADDENEREMLIQIAKRLANPDAWGGDAMFQVNPAFYQALQID